MTRARLNGAREHGRSGWTLNPAKHDPITTTVLQFIQMNNTLDSKNEELPLNLPA